MFGNSNGKNGTTNSSSINLIGVGTYIEGEVKSDGDIRIDGKINGTVVSKSKVVIGSTGVVEGNIYCENADVSGKIQGNIEVAELLFLKKTSVLEGDITTGKLVVEGGAAFNGKCTMGQKGLSEYAQPARKLEEETA